MEKTTKEEQDTLKKMNGGYDCGNSIKHTGGSSHKNHKGGSSCKSHKGGTAHKKHKGGAGGYRKY